MQRSEQSKALPLSPLKEQTEKAYLLFCEGSVDQAMEILDQVLAASEDYLPALIVKTLALLAQHDNQQALVTAQRALDLDPENVTQLLNQGLALYHLDNHEEALRTIDQALAIDPYQISAYINKSAILLKLDRYEQAREVIQQGLQLEGSQLQLLINEGTVWLGLERYGEALTATDTALGRYPEQPALLANRVLALSGLGYFSEALTTIKKLPETQVADLVDSVLEDLVDALDYSGMEEVIHRTNPADWNNLRYRCAQQLFARNRFDEVLHACELLLQTDPADWRVYVLKGRALARLMRFAEADAVLYQARSLNPQAFAKRYGKPPARVPPDTFVPDPDARKEYANWKIARILECDWSDYSSFVSHLPELIEAQLSAGRAAPLTPFHALLLPLSPAYQQAIAGDRSGRIARYTKSLQPQVPTFSIKLEPKKLRIGYVSADFREHATAHLMQGLFGLHDRNRFEIIGYSLYRDESSIYQQQIAADCDCFVDLSESSNTDAAQRIRQDRIDILVDLMGFTRYARAEIFALQPAPIQVNYLGYPGTMGAECIHYVIADPVVLPASLRPHFNEQPVWLPECYQVNHRQAIANTGLTRAEVGLPEEGFVFCCFNHHHKLEPEVFDVWMRLLHKIPHSVLWLFAETPAVITNLTRQAQRRGIGEQRLVFARYMDKPRHLERHRLADLFLDTFIYNAHTTASDALWAGLPVLTRCGHTFQSRVAASLLTAMDLPELIVNSTQEYENTALSLAKSATRLGELREKVQRNRLDCPLFNTPRWVRYLEMAFETMWVNYAAGNPPRPIDISSMDP